MGISDFFKRKSPLPEALERELVELSSTVCLGGRFNPTSAGSYCKRVEEISGEYDVGYHVDLRKTRLAEIKRYGKPVIPMMAQKTY